MSNRAAKSSISALVKVANVSGSIGNVVLIALVCEEVIGTDSE